MPLNLGRWVNYAKARVEAAVGRGNDELARLEAEREVELAEKPWLRADAESPTLDEARARIEFEAKRQQELTDARDRARASGEADGSATTSSAHDAGDAASTSTTDGAGSAVPADRAPGAPTPPGDPEALRLAAEAEQAKLAIEERDRAAAARLDEIRRELGVDAPPPDGSST